MTRLDSFKRKLRTVQSSIAPEELWLIGYEPWIQYLTGFEFLVPTEREAFLLLTNNGAHVVCSSFTPENVIRFMRELGITILLGTHKIYDHTKTAMAATKSQKIRVDSNGVTVGELLAAAPFIFVANHKTLSLENPTFDVPSIPREVLQKLRLTKDEYEQSCLQKAGTIIKEVMATVQSSLRTGMTEIEVKALLEYELQKAGSVKPAFPTIVAFGEHAVEPHYQPGTTPLQPAMAVLIDAGAVVDGYCSDMTRTIWFGEKPSEQFLRVEKVVKEGYDAAIRLAKTGVMTSDLDNAARNSMTTHDLEKYFIHTLGHGVGVEIHESPSVSANDHTILESGIAITIEPGLYLPPSTLPGQTIGIGYRYENTCLITTNGVVELT